MRARELFRRRSRWGHLGYVRSPAMRTGSGILNGVATVTAVHVSDLDHHVRAMRAANAELRAKIASLQTQLLRAEQARERRVEFERAVGARVLAVENELEQARIGAVEHVAAIGAAADEEVRRIVDASRAAAAQLQRALDALVGSAAPADVVVFTPRPVADARGGEPWAAEQSVAM